MSPDFFGVSAAVDNMTQLFRQTRFLAARVRVASFSERGFFDVALLQITWRIDCAHSGSRPMIFQQTAHKNFLRPIQKNGDFNRRFGDSRSQENPSLLHGPIHRSELNPGISGLVGLSQKQRARRASQV